MKPFKSIRTQSSFYDSVYENLVKPEHLLFKLNDIVDWSFIEEECRPFYSDMGRKGESPIVLFKMLFLSYLYNISERRIEEECTYNIVYKYFLGLELYQSAPDHSTLSKFRDRLGETGFRNLFDRVVMTTRQKGLVSDELRIIDATHQTADVDVHRKHEPKPEDKDKWISPQAKPGATDKDARFGAKSKTKKFFGYKHHTGIDSKHGVITNSATSPGHMHDGDYLEEMITGPKPEALTADKIYDYEYQHKVLQKQGIKSYIIRKEPDDEILADWDYHEAVRKRSMVERTYAVEKRYHGGSRARFRGLPKMTIQNLLTDITYNFKLLVQFSTPPAGEVCPNY